MIKYSEIKDLFASYDINAYEYNIETIDIVDLPLIVYTVMDGESFRADGICYKNFMNVSLAIIDENLSFTAQRNVEKVFDDNFTSYDKQVNFDDSERLYTITYNFEVFDDGVGS